MNPIEISPEEAVRVIMNPKASTNGLFWLYDCGKYIGIDNTTCDAWTEDFDTKQECFDWLEGKETR